MIFQPVVCDVSWDDIGGLTAVREKLGRIVLCARNLEPARQIGVMTHGVLLYGPAGCGKSMVAKAVANEAEASLFIVNYAELLRYHRGIRQAVRDLFQTASQNSPSIIFFDNVIFYSCTVDYLMIESGIDGNLETEKLKTEILSEFDNLGSAYSGVALIGATNRPDLLDTAMLRGGRFSIGVYVSLPGLDERCSILKVLRRRCGKSVDESVDLSSIAGKERCVNLSGADLAALMLRAAAEASDSETIKAVHFEQALAEISPSVGDEERERNDLFVPTICW